MNQFKARKIKGKFFLERLNPDGSSHSLTEITAQQYGGYKRSLGKLRNPKGEMVTRREERIINEHLKHKNFKTPTDQNRFVKENFKELTSETDLGRITAFIETLPNLIADYPEKIVKIKFNGKILVFKNDSDALEFVGRLREIYKRKRNG